MQDATVQQMKQQISSKMTRLLVAIGTVLLSCAPVITQASITDPESTSVPGKQTGEIAPSAVAQAIDEFRLLDASLMLKNTELSGEIAYYLNGRLAAAEYRGVDAHNIADLCLENYPESARCEELLGEALAIEMAQESDNMRQFALARQARSALQRSVAKGPDNLRARDLLIRYYQLAPWIAGGSRSKAKAEVRWIRANHPERADYAQGLFDYYDKDWDGAVKHLSAATRANPNDADARYLLGLARLEHGRDENALKIMLSVVQDFPQFWEAWFSLGTQFADDEANAGLSIAALSTFVSGAPEAGAKRLANAWYTIGLAHEKAGRLQDALTAYESALAAKPGHNESGDAAIRLRSALKGGTPVAPRSAEG